MYFLALMVFIICNIVVNCCTGMKSRARIARNIMNFIGMYETIFALYGIVNCWIDEDL